MCTSFCLELPMKDGNSNAAAAAFTLKGEMVTDSCGVDRDTQPKC